MGSRDQRQSLSEAEDRGSVAHPGENAQEAAGKGLLSMGEDKGFWVLGTVAPLISNQAQCIGYTQQFIDGATSLSKKCIYKLMFTNKSSKAHYKQRVTRCVEAAA